MAVDRQQTRSKEVIVARGFACDSAVTVIHSEPMAMF